MTQLIFSEVPIDSHDARTLIAALDNELADVFPDESIHAVESSKFVEQGGRFFVASMAGQAAACAALRPIDATTIELKRMFVAPGFRCQGISRQLLNHLELTAKSAGYDRLWLETGDALHAAMTLYRSAGFVDIAAFSDYVHDPLSKCLGKTLS